MIGRSTSFLGLAIAERSVVCAEVAPRGDGGTARRTATFALPAELSLDASPESVGAVLGAFLREHKFSATRCVVGVPARWLIAVEKDVPPTDESAARAMLRLQAERLAVAESGEVVFDFAGRSDSSAASKVLLVGMLRQRLERIEKVAQAAGLHVEAVTSTGLTLASCATGKGDEGGLLVLQRGGGEIVWRHNQQPRMLRHVAVSAMNGHGSVNMAPLTAELRRAVTLAQTNGGGRDLLLLDGVGLEEAQVDELSERLGVKLKSGRNTDVCGIASDPSTATPTEQRDPPARYAPAMSLALAGARPSLRPIDFKHSRLAPEKVRRFGARSSWGMVLGALALIGIVSLYVISYQRQKQLDLLNASLREIAPNVKEAQANVDRLKYARGYFETRPPVLDCLAELSQAFGENDRAWVKALSLANGKGTLNGQAADDAVVLAIVERIKKNPRFTEVKGPNTQQADPKTREVSFTVTFTFTAAEPVGTPQPATRGAAR